MKHSLQSKKRVKKVVFIFETDLIKFYMIIFSNLVNKFKASYISKND